jgi:hypothetical protein
MNILYNNISKKFQRKQNSMKTFTHLSAFLFKMHSKISKKELMLFIHPLQQDIHLRNTKCLCPSINVTFMAAKHKERFFKKSMNLKKMAFRTR